MQEIRNWTTTNYKGDFFPAFVDQRAGPPTIIVQASDFIGMTRSEAEDVARKRNAGQVARAEADVERLRSELVAAEAHLVRVKAILAPA